MTVRELICKLVELKFLGKITEDTRILSYSDEFDRLDECKDIKFISDNPSFLEKNLEEDIKYYSKRHKEHPESDLIRDALDDKVNTLYKIQHEWKDAIRIV